MIDVRSIVVIVEKVKRIGGVGCAYIDRRLEVE